MRNFLLIKFCNISEKRARSEIHHKKIKGKKWQFAYPDKIASSRLPKGYLRCKKKNENINKNLTLNMIL